MTNANQYEMVNGTVQLKPAYVLGILFSKDRQSVALIEKLKPSWMAGRRNGVGGKIEPGENMLEAMTREFHEEAGVVVQDWEWFCTLNHDGNDIYVFKAFGDHHVWSKTEERVRWTYVHEVQFWNRMRNLDWLIPLALSPNNETAMVRDVTPVEVS